MLIFEIDIKNTLPVGRRLTVVVWKKESIHLDTTQIDWCLNIISLQSEMRKMRNTMIQLILFDWNELKRLRQKWSEASLGENFCDSLSVYVFVFDSRQHSVSYVSICQFELLVWRTQRDFNFSFNHYHFGLCARHAHARTNAHLPIVLFNRSLHFENASDLSGQLCFVHENALCKRLHQKEATTATTATAKILLKQTTMVKKSL